MQRAYSAITYDDHGYKHAGGEVLASSLIEAARTATDEYHVVVESRVRTLSRGRCPLAKVWGHEGWGYVYRDARSALS
jgi:hypothetical protein